jgi:hypothetical protein
MAMPAEAKLTNAQGQVLTQPSPTARLFIGHFNWRMTSQKGFLHSIVSNSAVTKIGKSGNQASSISVQPDNSEML